MTLSQDDIVFLSRLFCDYIKNTKEGKKTVFSLLGTSVVPADIKSTYQLSAKYRDQKEFNYTDLTYYAGWIYQGSMGVGLNDIEVEKNGNMEACETTGIMGPRNYCIQVVKENGRNGRDILTSMSNYARLHSENQTIRETANINVCVKCPVRLCAYHPSLHGNTAIKLLPSTKGA
jgi:hypothetical protein